MKNKFLLALTLVFTMFFNVFAGCSFVQTNTSKYYNTVVAKVGDDIEITKYELMSAYNNYGYQYVQSSGYTTEKAMETVLDQLINREVIADYVSKNQATLFGTSELANWEISEIWEDVFEYVNDTQLLQYVNTIRKNQGLTEISVEEEESEEEEVFVRKAYESTIQIYENPNGTINKITSVPTTHNTTLDIDIDDFEYKFFGETSDLNTRINELAREQFKYYLKTAEEDKKITDETQILKNHLNELFKTYKKTYFIQKFKECYNDNKELSIESILAKYTQQVKIDYQTYGDALNKSSYISAVQSDASKVYFHPYSDELIYVSHILVKYDKDNGDFNLKDDYATKLKKGEISQTEYDELMKDENLGNSCKVYEMEEGKFKTEPTDMNAIDLYNYVKTEVEGIENTKDRLDKFIDLAYQYNQDTAMFSAGDFYTIQLDTTYADTMVKEFADLSRKLYNEQGVGSVGICYTQYGAHIVYVVGKVENKLATDATDNKLNSITIEQLRNTILTSNQYEMFDENHNEIGKTLLDVLAEKVKSDDYETYVAKRLNDIKNENGKNYIKIYKYRYNDLIKED